EHWATGAARRAGYTACGTGRSVVGTHNDRRRNCWTCWRDWRRVWRHECDRPSAYSTMFCFSFQAEVGIRALTVTGVQTCALPISSFHVPGAQHGTGPAVNNNNAYVNMTARLYPTAPTSTDPNLTSLTYQSGTLGRFYLPG